MIYISKIILDRDEFFREQENSYLTKLPLLQNFDTLPLTSPITLICGENGSGKSTLIEAIATAWGFNPEGGSKNFAFSTRESHSQLCDYLTLVKGTKRPRDGFFLRAESFFNVATNIEEMDNIPAAAPKIIEGYGGRSLHEQSHGESFMTLIEQRFFGNGLYILDEPEAALSPTRILALIHHIRRLAENGSQFIISTHSPILLSCPGADVYEITASGIRKTDYRRTEAYIVTKRCLTDPSYLQNN